MDGMRFVFRGRGILRTAAFPSEGCEGAVRERLNALTARHGTDVFAYLIQEDGTQRLYMIGGGKPCSP